MAAEDTTTNGKACATAWNELTACELASCVAYCPVTSDTDQTGITALLGDGTATNPGCLSDADQLECTTQFDAVNTACAYMFDDAGNPTAGSAFAKCEAVEKPLGGTAAPTAAQFSAYFKETCGG
jgi:hypothetical protein